MSSATPSVSWNWGDGSNSFGVPEEEEEEHETPYQSKDCLLIMIDANATMFQEFNGAIPFKSALKAVSQVYKSKIVANENDLIGLAFYNTEQQKNTNDFKGIYVHDNLDNPDVSRILALHNAIGDPDDLNDGLWFPNSFPHGHGSASFANVLWSVSSVFGECKQTPKNARRRVFLMTNDDNPNEGNVDEQSRARIRAQDLAKMDIDIELFAFHRDGKEFNPSIFFRDIIVEDEDGVAPEISAIEKFEDIENAIKRKEFKRRVYATIPLCLCEDPRIDIAVDVFNLLIEVKVPGFTWLDMKTNKEVKSSTKWLCEDTGAHLAPDRIARYFPYGDAKVRFTPEEIKKMKVFAEPGLKIMGFKPKKKLDPYLNLKHSTFIMANDKHISGSTALFLALHRKMVEADKIAICRFIPRRNAAVRFIALLPQEEVSEDGLLADVPLGMHAITLPFADDIRNLSVDPNLATVEQIREMKRVVKALSINFDSEWFPNPVLQNHHQVIQALALDAKTLDDIEDRTLPDVEGMEKVSHIIEGFKDVVYPEYYAPMEKAITGTKRKADGDGGPAWKKAATDISEIDFMELCERNLLGTVVKPALLAFLRQQKVSCSSSMKKDELIEKVKRHLGY